MKAIKNRSKLLRVTCGHCKAQQDSLSLTCTNCHHPLYANFSENELIEVRKAVTTLEEVLVRIEQGQTARPNPNPYQDYDLARAGITQLNRFGYLPGMPEYLSACKKVSLPFRIALMEKTVRANLVFCLLLLLFASVPMLLGWPFSVTGLLCLPAAVWILVTLKAYFALRKAVQELKG